MIICIAGKNDIAVNATEYLLLKYPQIPLIAITNKSDTGINSWQKSFTYFCLNNKIKIVDLQDVYSIADLIFISLEFDRIIIPDNFLSKNLFNIHFSKLPSYKGMYTSVMPLYYGEYESGVTLHKIDKGIDTGPIIDQLCFSIDISTTARNLYDLYLEYGMEIFKNNVEYILSGNYTTVPQSSQYSSYFSKAALSFSELNIDLNRTAFQVHNQIRAFTFRDYQLPIIKGHLIYKSVISNIRSTGKSGSIIEENEFEMIINTIDYNIVLYKDKLNDLLEAAKTGNFQLFQQLESSGYPVTLRTKEGWDAFIVACYHNQFSFVKELIAAGWDIETSNYKGTTALMYSMTAAANGLGEECFKLLFKFADKTKKDDRGKDVFDYAKEYNYKIY